ncbi:MAG: hypothetical protein U9O98_06610 [Asgard group archaeon]|nr:hypothetical protein [Asgard group archaeon]
MSTKFTLNDLIRIFGEEGIPEDIDRQILIRHFNIGANRLIGEKTIKKLRLVLNRSIEAARAEQNKHRGEVLASPIHQLKKDSSKPKTPSKSSNELSSTPQKEPETVSQEDKYGLTSIQKGIVSQRLHERTQQKDSKPKSDERKKHGASKNLLSESSNLPSVEELSVLAGEALVREDNGEHAEVQREIAIRDYKVETESQSPRWDKTEISQQGPTHEITHPSYIFHSDLWQLEEARSAPPSDRCEILQHVILDMVANSINVVMLDKESEPFFVVEGYGILHSKDTLKEKIRIYELIQLLVISCDAWEIALKEPESLLKGKKVFSEKQFHNIDMTSVIPLSKIRRQTIEFDNRFRSEFNEATPLVNDFKNALLKHRKDILWNCGESSIRYLRKAVHENKMMLENSNNELHMVVIGTDKAIHPINITMESSEDLSFAELLPNYCNKHSILDETSLRSVFGSIPAVFSSDTLHDPGHNLIQITQAVQKRLLNSVQELVFNPQYKIGNPCDIFPISNLSIVLPPEPRKLQNIFENKGFFPD